MVASGGLLHTWIVPLNEQLNEMNEAPVLLLLLLRWCRPERLLLHCTYSLIRSGRLSRLHSARLLTDSRRILRAKHSHSKIDNEE